MSISPPKATADVQTDRFHNDLIKNLAILETDIVALEAEDVALDGRIDTLETLVASKQLASGTYTPTLYNTTNVANSSTYQAFYMRVGGVCYVAGKVDIDVTSTGNTVMGCSLPIASNLTSPAEAGGTFAGDTTAQFGAIYGDNTNDRVTFRYQATSTSNTGFFYHFSYRII